MAADDDGRALWRDWSDDVTEAEALRTSVIDVLAEEPWPDLRRLWCMGFCGWPFGAWAWLWLASFGRG